ncbi:MAG: HU family DNA-binding protein [Candidatus Phytoplasma pruni]|uniref:HU family DNA-binding protein n=1 Tax=Poinsettia branch-inducing phytoplasma TaxID=138647 RepID=UPI000685F9D2|nr:HU family DNA-binding protein [Poinsettia branch-inducing phytoplasma]WEK82612.1 MAG: HU family DNA-binding protein [Candidatus Phytoplasma pruni]
MAKKNKKKNTQHNVTTCGKKDLIKEIATTTQNTVKATEEFYNAFEKNLFQAIATHEKVTLSPYIGKFVLKTRGAYIGRNPQTGKKLKIPSKTVVSFKIASILKQEVADLEII